MAPRPVVRCRSSAAATSRRRRWPRRPAGRGPSAGARSRKPRTVWSNPIAWREAKTKASAARASLLRYGFIAAGLVGAVVLVYRFSQVDDAGRVGRAGRLRRRPSQQLTIGRDTYQVPPFDATTATSTRSRMRSPTRDNPGQTKTEPFDLGTTSAAPMEVVGDVARRAQAQGLGPASVGRSPRSTLRPIRRVLEADDARKYLLGVTVIEFAIILLIVTNAAASTVTREKEDGTLDLLLSSPITSRYYIWGKLRGLVSFVLPLVAVPVASVLMFVIYDVVAPGRLRQRPRLPVDRLPRGRRAAAGHAHHRLGLRRHPGHADVAALPHDGDGRHEQRRHRRRRSAPPWAGAASACSSPTPAAPATPASVGSAPSARSR